MVVIMVLVAWSFWWWWTYEVAVVAVMVLLLLSVLLVVVMVVVVEIGVAAVAVAAAAAISSGSDCGFWSWWCLLFWASIYIRRNSKTRKYSAVPGLGPSSVQTRCEPGRGWGQARASWARTLGELGASLGASSEQARGRGIHANASTGTCTAERS